MDADTTGIEAPPYRPAGDPAQAHFSGPHGREVSVALKATMVVLGVSSIVMFAAIGAVVALFWLFAACFGESCTDREMQVFFLPLIVGIVGGLGVAGVLGFCRTWFYRHPAVVWVWAALFGVIAVIGLSLLVAGLG